MLVHVGAPVRESTFGSKVIPPSLAPDHLPSFYSLSSFDSAAFRFLLVHPSLSSSFLHRPCNGAPAQLVLTRLIQMKPGLLDVSRD